MKKRLFCFCLAVVFWHGYACAAFFDNGDGTITESVTGLMWQKATAPGTYTWDQAKAYCENLALGGQSDWRLPTRNELQSIVNYNAYNPAAFTAFFPDTVASDYWSSTTYAYGTDYAWIVSFGFGSVNGFSKTNGYYVRAVRAGQCGSLGSSTTTTQPTTTTTQTTTTTTVCSGPCCAVKVLGEDNPKLENLRNFRDSTLAQSAVGRKVIQIYYNNADSINAALENSPALRAVTRSVLEVIAPMVGRKEE